MPGPNIVNKAQQAKRAEAAQRQIHYLTDPNCTEIMGMPVTDDMRKNGLVLTANQALTLVAAGAVTTDKAAAEKAAQDMQARADALAEQKRTAAEAVAVNNEAQAAANLHNFGEQTLSQTDLDKANKVVAGTLSPEEVDQKLATKPADETAPAPSSAEPTGTWADQQHAS